MGELVSGIGDEVLFFVAFIVTSMCLYIGVLWYKYNTENAGHRENRPPAPEEHGTEDASNVQRTSVPRSSTPQPQSTLRSRFQPSTDSSQSRVQSESEEGSAGRPISEEHSGGDETSQAGSTSPHDSSQTRVQSESETMSHEGSAGHPISEESSGGDETSQAGSTSPDDRMINIRLIKPDGSLPISVAANTTLQTLRSNYFQAEVAQNRPVKFIFQGRVLGDNDASVQSLGITNGRAVHVHIGRPRPPGEPPNDAQEPDQEMDLSGLFVPLFGVILGIVWVSMLCYPQLFGFMTKFFLFLLSLGYVMLSYVTTFG